MSNSSNSPKPGDLWETNCMTANGISVLVHITSQNDANDLVQWFGTVICDPDGPGTDIYFTEDDGLDPVMCIRNEQPFAFDASGCTVPYTPLRLIGVFGTAGRKMTWLEKLKFEFEYFKERWLCIEQPARFPF